MTLPGVGRSQSSAVKPVPANFSPRGFPSCVRKYARSRSISARNAAWASRALKRRSPAWRVAAAQRAKILRQHRELRMMDRAVVQEQRRGRRARRRTDLAQPAADGLAGGRRRQVARPFLQEPPQRMRRDEPPVQQRGDAACADAARRAARTPARRRRLHAPRRGRCGTPDRATRRRAAAPRCCPRGRIRDRRPLRAETRAAARGRRRRSSRPRCRRAVLAARASAPRRARTCGSPPSAAR